MGTHNKTTKLVTNVGVADANCRNWKRTGKFTDGFARQVGQVWSVHQRARYWRSAATAAAAVAPAVAEAEAKAKAAAWEQIQRMSLCWTPTACLCLCVCICVSVCVRGCVCMKSVFHANCLQQPQRQRQPPKMKETS